MKIIAWIIKGTLTVLVLVALLLIVRGFSDARIDYDVSTEGVSIPQYTAIDIPLYQSNDFSSAHPFAAGAIIDIDNDGIEELFLGGGPGVKQHRFGMIKGPVFLE